MTQPCAPTPGTPIGDGTDREACGGPHWCQHLPSLQDCWYGLSQNELHFGQDCADRYGVGVGCAQCDDFPQKWVRGTPLDGTRFLLPYVKFSEQAPFRARRDANGNLHDLLAGKPWRMALHATFLRGNGFRQLPDMECVGDSCVYAGLEPSHFVVPFSSFCEGGESQGDALHGFFPDTTAFAGHKFPQPGESIYQRFVDERLEPGVVRLPTNYLFQVALHRTFPCTENMLIGCMEETPGAPPNCSCDASWFRTFEGQQCGFDEQGNPGLPDPGFINEDGGSRPFYDRLLLTHNTAAVRGPADRLFQFDAPSLAIKNAALSLIRSEELPGFENAAPVRLDQVDVSTRGGALPRTGNWSRDWNFSRTGNLAPVGALPVLPVAVTGRLQQSNLEIKVEPVLLLATIELSMVAQAHTPKSPGRLASGDTGFPDTFTGYQFEPQIRMVISGRWGLRLVEEIDHELPGGQAVTVTQPDIYSDPWPLVAGDRAVYRTNNGMIPEFERIEWWGCLSSFSVPAVPSLGMASSGLTSACRSLQRNFNQAGIAVHGWPSYSDAHPEDSDRNSVYGGSIGLRFLDLEVP